MMNTTTETQEENQECGIPEAKGKMCLKCHQEVLYCGHGTMFVGFSDMEVNGDLGEIISAERAEGK